jgi:p-cumate 2,3-dioxygenase ferredoxin subunit
MRIDLIDAEQVPEGSIAGAQLPDGSSVAIYNVAGAFYVTSDFCTHGEASLSEEGYLEGKIVECPWHYGSFDVTTGEAQASPCTIALKTYPALVVGGKVTIEIQEG